MMKLNKIHFNDLIYKSSKNKSHKMKNLKVELFNFKKSLTIEQEEVSRILEAHLNVYDQLSEIQIVESLKQKLEIYRYDKAVTSLLENTQAEISENSLVYDLRDLYKRVQSINQGEVYRHPMKVIADIMNEQSEPEMIARILNELAIYDFVPPIKKFLLRYTADPLQRANLTSEGGKAEKIFTIVEQIEAGHLTFIKDKWFLITEAAIEPTTTDKWFNETDKLRSLNLLAKAVELAEINDKSITFSIDENLSLGLDTKDGSVILNGEKTAKETTIDNVFSSPIVPFMKRDFYPVLVEASKNLDKFVDLDIAMKIVNVTNPFLESFVFNYKDNMYAYNVDRRYGSTFYQYSSAVELVNEVKHELGFDLTYFFKNKFDSEVIVKRNLEDREKSVLENLSELDFNINRLNIPMLLENDQIQAAKTELVNEKKKFKQELLSIRELRTKASKEKTE